MSRSTRALVARLALAAYALPLGLGVGSGLGHAADHVVAHLRAQHAKAVAMGLTHAPATAAKAHDATHVPLATPKAEDGITHAHGGIVHSHDGAVETLLTAAADVSGEIGDAESATSGVSTHVPVSLVATSLLPGATGAAAPASTLAPTASTRAPLLPPPRA